MPKRILVLGVTGVDKAAALTGLARYRATVADARNLVGIDFEKEFVREELYDYLDARVRHQRSMWSDAWRRFSARLRDLHDRDVVLFIHGVLVRPLYGLRTPLALDSLREFGPTTIITLIDDVYLQWFRTERRARGLGWHGRPTLEQLISARRAEVFLGDVIANHVETGSEIRNYVVAVRHPARLMERLIFGPERLRTIYLSFPISGPRELEQRGDSRGIAEVNRFITQAAQFERATGSVGLFCPLTIDEFPMIRGVEDEVGEVREFGLSQRWDVRAFFGPDDILLLNESEAPTSVSLRTEQIMDCRGLVEADVATRDYRLVAQARRLAVFNPWFNGKQARGVDNEIACALFHHIPVHVYQDPAHDPDAQARAHLQRDAGSLGVRPGAEYIAFHNSVEELFAELAR